MINQSEVIAAVKNLVVSIAVFNLEETAKWYKEQLGFEEVVRREFPEFDTRILLIETDDVRIELIEEKN
ncbi:hypothetical protein IQ230_21440 [Gloeocapsopsis crepidinum LEGE 06123]|uniref:VOC domain-containing protein n=1 Tax=Gloeocapsopsis crepidinum LEGE 06123 TaxID=588587 RepID=A0ABR9UX47_9CHRO|nr:VOC family protein [Gloeocapsopsis crepidinum]MBE9192869.1 hypothetical protein [Gloeocapsopsis crepidinum LEGE 06123]